MPSPFPGMDPYLEGHLFQDVHHALANEIRDRLAPHVAPKYVARLMTYHLVAGEQPISSAGGIYPDVDVSIAKSQGSNNTAVREAAVACVTRGVINSRGVTPPVIMFTPGLHKVELVAIEIRDRVGNDLVTAIEILSPANKEMPGLGQYVRKRNVYLRSRANLLEIDLLRHGTRSVETPALPAATYLVTLSRASNRRQIEVWPVNMSDPLPVVAVPLRPEDGDVPLDLGAALSMVYDRARYDLSIDYSAPPVPALTHKESEWATEWLRSRRSLGQPARTVE